MKEQEKDDLLAQDLFVDYVFAKSKQERKDIKLKLLYYVWHKHNKLVRSMNDLIWKYQHGKAELEISIEQPNQDGLWLGQKECLEHFYL